MKFTYTCKKVSLNDSIKNYAEKRISKLERYFREENPSAAVTFSVEKNHLCTVEITIRDGGTLLRAQTQAPIYLYTARTQGLDELMPILDGVTLTLHEPGDCLPFWRFDQSTQSLDGKSLRLNIFEEVGPVASSERWQVKDHMAWIPNCPLPQGEVLMRFRPYGG